MNTNYLLFQINDAAFPIGSYTQSYGLETYILNEKIHDQETAFLYLQSYLLHNFLYTELLGASLAYEYATQEDAAQLHTLDCLLRASKLCREIREASEKLGNRFVKTVIEMGVATGTTFESVYAARNRNNVNHCSAYGFLCGTLAQNKEEMLRLYLFQTASAIVTNCVKMIPMSQLIGQQLLTHCYDVFDRCMGQVESLSIDQLGISSPGFDLSSMQHEVLYSRLYMS